MKPAEEEGLGAVAVEGGGLQLATGLLSLLRPALMRLAPGGVVAIRGDDARLEEDLASWCRSEGHVWHGSEVIPGSGWVHRIGRGHYGALAAEVWAPTPAPQQTKGRITSASLLEILPFPSSASPSSFSPRGIPREPGSPTQPFFLREKERVAPKEVGELLDQAAASPWDPSSDIPWDRIPELSPQVEGAVAQIMAFLAENEVAALYVPARFLPTIHPAYLEVAMFLATQLADEARHIDAFLKRARARGAAPGISSATTARSLLSLLIPYDFTEATFLLSVLGEGTFLDLLRFVETHAPDPATAEVARRARLDEARHVHFGVSHVRGAMAADPALGKRLTEAVQKRASHLEGGSVPAPVQDALVILAAGSHHPVAVATGHRAFRDLLTTMEQGRIRRIQAAGFSMAEATALSALHTPNFM